MLNGIAAPYATAIVGMVRMRAMGTQKTPKFKSPKFCHRVCVGALSIGKPPDPDL